MRQPSPSELTGGQGDGIHASRQDGTVIMSDRSVIRQGGTGIMSDRRVIRQGGTGIMSDRRVIKQERASDSHVASLAVMVAG